MKRIAFLIVVAISSVVANGNAVYAQNFKSTGHGSFAARNGETISSLPPMTGQTAAQSVIITPAEPAATTPTKPIFSVSPATPTATVSHASPPQHSVAPSFSPQQQMAAQQALTTPQFAPAQQVPAAQQIIVNEAASALSPQSFANRQSFATQQSVASPTTGAPILAPIYNQQTHGDVFTSQAEMGSYAPSNEIYAGESQLSNSSPQEFVIEESQLIPEQVIAQGRRKLLRRNDGCTSCVENRLGRAGLNRLGANRQGIVNRPGVANRQVIANRPGIANRLSRPNRSVYSTVGASALLLNRNTGTNRDFSTNGAGDLLSSNNAESDVLAGIDVFLARRNSAGRGWEARYFGLYPEDESIQIGNNATNLIPGLNQLGAAITGTGPTATVSGDSVGDLFDRADTHVLTRQTELNNLEFNLLKCSAPRFRAASTEFLFGFRYFQFGETLLNEALNVPNGDPTFVGPNSIGYSSAVENNLVGLQIGARSDYRLRNRLMMHVGIKAGAFNNRVNTRQRVDYRMPDGSIANPTVAGGTLSGRLFDIGTEEDVKSLLGELDFAVSYQLSSSSRIRVGYRALGVTDIAFASNQIQDDFTDASGLSRPTTDGDLVLQGGYAGIEFAY